MTERNPALWLQNRTDHTAEQERALITGLYLGKEGVMAQDDLKVVQRAAGANMSVDVGAGKATVVGDDNAAQGVYAVWNDAAKNVTISAADGTNPRRDIIVARIKDAFYSGALNTFTLEVITGTPAGSPADPSIPNNCLPLARVAVAAGASSITNANITDLRNRVGTMAACDIICTSSTRPASPFQGMRIYETDTHRALVYAGATSGWRPPWNISWGRVGLAINASYDVTASGTTPQDVPGVSFSVDEVAGRTYRAIAQTDVYSTVNNDAVACIIVRNGSPIGRALTKLPSASESSAAICFVTYTATVTQTITWKMQFGRFVGSGTAHGIAISTVPATLLVEDIGPAANPT